MSKHNKNKITIYVVACCVVLVFGIKFGVEYVRSGVERTSRVSRAKGDKNAPVQVTEYIDFQCPACAVGAKFLKTFMEENPKIIRLEMKYYPFQMHSHAYQAARYAECATRQNKFWELHDNLIDQQKDWSVLADAKPAFDEMARKANMDFTSLNLCLEDLKVSQIILEDKEEGVKLGVRSTPSYFVNGKLVVGLKALQKELAPYIKN